MTVDLATEFALASELIHLNHAAVGPWPQRTANAVAAFADANVHHGSQAYPQWIETEQRLRERLARLIRVAPEDIALLKSTSEGLSVIAHGLSWNDGDNVVIPKQEFPSNRIVWESLRRYGVEVRYADVNDPDPEQALLALSDRHTRLMSVSAVQYGNGLRMDLARLGQACRTRGILLCVDAIQWLGALPFDAEAIEPAFVVADGHKWMLGPEGLALFYCRPDLREALTLHQFGWHMVQHPGEFDRPEWEPARDARRFECGSPNLLGAHGLEASLSLLEEVGMDTVAQGLSEVTAYLVERIQRHPSLVLLSPADPQRRAGIITFRHQHHDSGALYRYLMERQVLCAHRAGGVRFSPHFYTAHDRIDRALDLIDRFD